MKRDQTCWNEHTQPHANSHQLCVSIRPHWTASEQKDVIVGRNILLSTNSAKKARDFSFLRNVQTGSGAHPASYSVDEGGSFLAVNRVGREFNHPPSPIPKVKNEWNYTSTPLHIFMAWTGKHYLYAH